MVNLLSFFKDIVLNFTLLISSIFTGKPLEMFPVSHYKDRRHAQNSQDIFSQMLSMFMIYNLNV